MNYRLAKQEGNERQLLDHVVTEYDVNGSTLLVFRGEMSKKEFAVFVNNLDTAFGDGKDVLVMQVAPDEDIESYRIESAEDE